MDNVVLLFILCVVTPTILPSQIAWDSTQGGDRRVSRDWGPWTGWSVCSETCGYGTAYRIRQCHAHHYRQTSSTACQGPPRQYKLCILKNCTDDQSDYRTRECAKHNNIYYGHHRYSWIPYINSQAPCELSCKSLGFGYYARFHKTVADFVVCNDENTAVCIQGQCVKSGCDGILNSGTEMDRCGVCGGDGTSCRIIQGIFTRTHLAHQGYNIITTIPEGACSINVTEMGRSNNHLALSTPSGYLLNGNMRLQSDGSVKGAGTTFTYGRGTGDGCPGECLTSPGPLNTSLRVELIYFGRNPGIFYQFSIPRDKTHKTVNSMTSPVDGTSASGSWHLSSLEVEERMSQQNDADQVKSRTDIIQRINYGKSPSYMPHTRPKNPLHQLHISTNVASSKPSPFHQSSSSALDSDDKTYKSGNKKQDRSGDHLAKHRSLYADDLKVQHGINNLPHDPSYLTSKLMYEHSNNQFYLKGENGSIEYKHYYHTNIHDNIGDIPVVAPLDADSKETDGIHRNKRPAWLPSSTVNDNRYAEFQSTHQQQPPTRSSSLPSIIANSLQNQPDNNLLYSQTNRISQQTDYHGHDNRLSGGESRSYLYSWRISGFTPCSDPCGGGLQETRVICIKEDSQVEVMEENCVQSIKPESTTMVCNTQPCEAKWEISEWGMCSVTCGRGLQKRAVECKQRISHTLTLSLPSTSCPQPQPITRQYCQQEPCFMWKISDWSKCSSECGFGQRARTASCVNSAGEAVNASLCTQVRPPLEEICDMGSCAHGWFHSKWSQQCSAECGWGHYTREVYCLAADGSRLDEKKCGGNIKPRERRLCRRAKQCGGHWFTGAWSQCNATCGAEAYRHRDVLCIKQHGKMVNQVVKEHNCIKEHKPHHKEACGPFPSCKPQWFVMPWSKCSEPCATGVKTREVKCLDTFFSASPDCSKDHKPSRRQPCNTQPCKEKAVVFSESSVTVTNEALQMDGSASSNYHPVCKDSKSARWCLLAKQARLCHYSHYRKICCQTCRKLDSKHH